MTAPLAGRLVLVVDDDADSRDAVAAILEFHGAAVLHAEDGAEALKRLRVLVADVVITDIKMPGTSGIEFLRAVRAEPRLAATCVIGLTGVADLASPMWDAGFDDVLLKPVRAEALMHVIVRHLKSGSAP